MAAPATEMTAKAAISATTMLAGLEPLAADRALGWPAAVRVLTGFRSGVGFRARLIRLWARERPGGGSAEATANLHTEELGGPKPNASAGRALPASKNIEVCKGTPPRARWLAA
jgi:hypothetical protein